MPCPNLARKPFKENRHGERISRLPNWLRADGGDHRRRSAGASEQLFLAPDSHAAAVVACDRTDLVAVSDVVAEKRKPSGNATTHPAQYSDYREMLVQERPDIVCIATRPATHAEMTVFAAENGIGGIY